MTTRNTYTNEFKQEMIRRLATGESPKVLSEETGVSKRTLEGWKRFATKQGSAEIRYESEEIHKDSIDISELRQEITVLRERYETLKEENTSLKEENASFKKEIESIKEESRLVKEEQEFFMNRFLVWREKAITSR